VPTLYKNTTQNTTHMPSSYAVSVQASRQEQPASELLGPTSSAITHSCRSLGRVMSFFKQTN